MSLPLSGWRYRWHTEALTAPERLVGGLVADALVHQAVRHGAAFRAMRTECGLGLRETVAGWGISAVEMSALERGERRFVSPADLKAALDQLWLWGVERNPGLAR